jgi:hypothetical protein
MLPAHIGTTIAITPTLKAMLLERPAQLRAAFVRIDTSIAWLMAHLTRARSRADFAILKANVKAARKASILISSVRRLARRASMVLLSPRREQRRRQTAPMSRLDFYSDPASDMIT